MGECTDAEILTAYFKHRKGVKLVFRKAVLRFKVKALVCPGLCSPFCLHFNSEDSIND